MLFVTDERVTTEEAPVAAITWSSHRLKRVARSSLATEGMALCEAVEAAEHLRASLAELLWPALDYRRWEEASKFAKVVACTDAKSVYDHVTREAGTPGDKRLALDLVALKEFFHDQVTEDSDRVQNILRWLPGPRNVADGMTKYLAVQDLLIAVLQSGRYTVADVGELEARAAAVKDRYRRRKKQQEKEKKADAVTEVKK